MKKHLPCRPQPVPPVPIIENGCGEQFFAQTPFFVTHTVRKTKSVIGFGNLLYLLYKKELDTNMKIKNLMKTGAILVFEFQTERFQNFPKI